MIKKLSLFSFVFLATISFVQGQDLTPLTCSVNRDLERCEISINSPQEFQSLSELDAFCAEICEGLPYYVTLTQNILFSNTIPDSNCVANFSPIMNFSGTLDGNGHSIAGLCLKDSEQLEMLLAPAIFYHTDKATFKNLTLKNIFVSSESSEKTAVLVNNASVSLEMDNIELYNITVVAKGYASSGILVSELNNDTANVAKFNRIKGSDLNLLIYGDGSVGGLIGYSSGNKPTEITNSSIKLNVTHLNTAEEKPVSLNFGGLMGETYGAKLKNDSLVLNVSLKNSNFPQETFKLGGFIGNAFGKVFVDDVVVSGNIESTEEISQEEMPYTPIYLGGILGSADGDTIIINNAKISSDFKFSYMNPSELIVGSAVGYVYATTLNMQNVTYDGEISFNNSNGDNISIGGFVGIYSTPEYNYNSSSSTATQENLEMKGKINFSLLQDSYRTPINLQMGGVFGTYQGYDENPYQLMFNNIKVSGNITLDAAGTAPYIGGIVGNLQAGISEVNVQNSDISASISAKAIYTQIGGLFGAVTANSISLTNNKVSSSIDVLSKTQLGSVLEIASPELTIGGLIGHNNSWNTITTKNKVSSNIVVDYDKDFFENPDMYVHFENSALGGLIGKINSYREGAITSTIDSSSFEGSIKVSNAIPLSYIGGFIGFISNCHTTISNSFAKNADTLLAASNTATETQEMTPLYMGGLIGGVLGDWDLEFYTQIEQTFVDGLLELNAKVLEDGQSLLAGFIGTNDKYIEASNAYFVGKLSTETPDAVGVYGLHYTTLNSSDALRSVYVVDFTKNAQQLTNTDPWVNYETALANSTDSLVKITSFINSNIIYDSLSLATPAFAAALNNTRPVWYQNQETNNGLPQLTIFKQGQKPTLGVYFYDRIPNEDPSITSSSYVISNYFTDNSGKLAFQKDGSAIKFNLLPPALYFAPEDSTLVTFYKNSAEVRPNPSEGLLPSSLWNGDSNHVYTENTFFHKMSARVAFPPLDSIEGAIVQGYSSQFLLEDSLPKMLLHNPEENNYYLYSSWEIPDTKTICENTSCLWDAIAQIATERDTIAINIFPASNYETFQHFIQFELMEGMDFKASIWDTAIDTTLSILSTAENFIVPRVSQMVISKLHGIPEDALEDSLLVIVNDSEQYEVALGDTISLPSDYNANITVVPKIYYYLKIQTPNSTQPIFQTAEMPKKYFYRQKEVLLPNLATVTRCLSNYRHGQEQFYYEEERNLFVWNPIQYGNALIYADFVSCVPETDKIKIEADSGVTTIVSHYGQELNIPGQTGFKIPLIGNLRFDVKTTPIADEFRIDSLAFNEMRLEGDSVFYTNQGGVLKVFMREMKDIFKIQKAILAQSGTAMRYSITPEEIEIYHPMHLNVQVFSEDSVLLIDTVLTRNAESGKEYTFEHYPLAPGNYFAKANLFTTNNTETKSYPLEVSAFFNKESITPQSWSMISLANLDTSKWKPENNDNATLYWWNEKMPVGEYWQYQRLETAKDISPMNGYWFFAEDSLTLPLLSKPVKAKNDTLSFELENNYSGWNLLSNPYSWDIAINQAEAFMDAENAEEPAWVWNGKANSYEPITTLKANTAFFMHTEETRTLSISSKPVYQEQDSTKILEKAQKPFSKESWSLRLKLMDSDEKSGDTWNVIGVGSRSLAIEKPPVGMNQKLSLATQGNHRLLAKSIKQIGESLVWNLSLQANVAQTAKFKIEGLNKLLEQGYIAKLLIDGKAITIDSEDAIALNLTASSKNAVLKIEPKATLVSPGKIQNFRFAKNGQQLQVSFTRNNSDGALATVRLMDSQGKTLTLTNKRSTSGENSLALDVPQASGSFFLNLLVGKESKTIPLNF